MMVRSPGHDPGRRSAVGFEPTASANSAKSAFRWYRRRASIPHDLAVAALSTRCVCLFRHAGKKWTRVSDSHRRGAGARLLCRQLPSMLGQPELILVAVAGACPGPRRYERRARLIRHPAVELVHSVGIEPTSPRLQRGASTWLASSALWYWSCAPDSRRALVCTRDLRRCLRLRSRRTGIPARLCTASFGFGDRRAAVEHHGDVLGRAASVDLAQPGCGRALCRLS